MAFLEMFGGGVRICSPSLRPIPDWKDGCRHLSASAIAAEPGGPALVCSPIITYSPFNIAPTNKDTLKNRRSKGRKIPNHLIQRGVKFRGWKYFSREDPVKIILFHNSIVKKKNCFECGIFHQITIYKLNS